MAGELTTETSPVDRMMTALCDRFAEHPTLKDVPIFSGPVSWETEWGEAINLLHARGSIEWGASGTLRRKHDWSVIGQVLALSGGDPSVEVDIRRARARAFELLAAIEESLVSPQGARVKDSSGRATALSAAVTSIEVEQGVDPDRGQWARVEFTIESLAHTIRR